MISHTLEAEVIKEDPKALHVSWNGLTLWVDRNEIFRSHTCGEVRKVSFRVTEARYADLVKRAGRKAIGTNTQE